MMKSKTGRQSPPGSLGLHPKQRMARIRTWSSDSGCDMVSSCASYKYFLDKNIFGQYKKIVRPQCN